jgi:uncharacterized membrane protein
MNVAETLKTHGPESKQAAHPFRSAVLRGMGIVAPPLLTIVIFVWVGGTIQEYVLRPVASGTRNTLVWYLTDVRKPQDFEGLRPGQSTAMADGRPYHRLENGTFIPLEVFDRVTENQGAEPLPQTGIGYYQRYVELRYLQPYVVIPFFLCVFILVVYLLGKFMAAGIGRIAYNLFEQGVHRLPLVRNVYSSVKQVSDFFFSERHVEFKRVVAIEYPRKGIWAMGFVTGEGFLDVRAAVNEPVVSVLIATSPAPMTGFTAIVKRSEVIDLNITIEQAFEYLISCGVVVPAHQLQQMITETGPQSAPDILHSDGSPQTGSEQEQVAGSGA